jgi:hypothetical protein
MLNSPIGYKNNKEVLIDGVKNKNVRAFWYFVYSE